MNEATTRVIKADELNFWGDRFICEAIDDEAWEEQCFEEAVVEETRFVSGKEVVHRYCETHK